MTSGNQPVAIDLAREADFALGGVNVRPSLRQLDAGGKSETLEPRVMQVLVALSRRRGQVVSRDELIQQCWSGRAVGDDAIGRAIAGVRRLGETHGAFTVETIPRVGYLMAEAGAPPASKSTAPTSSIAVLPFDDVSPAGDQAHLSKGMTEELLARLRRMQGLTVAGGEWVRGLMSKDPDPRALGRNLGVAYLLEGSVRKDGERLRIAARLLGASDGFLIWSEDYDRDLRDIFAVQEIIAAAVADALSVALAVGVQSATHGGTKSFPAYDHYLRGLALNSTRPPERPVHELEKAVAIDPAYARAWAELTFAYGGMLRLAASPAEREAILQKMDHSSTQAQVCGRGLWTGPIARAWYRVATNDWLGVDAAQQDAASLGHSPDPQYYRQQLSLSHHFGRFTDLLQSYDVFRRLDGRRAETDIAMLEYHSVRGEFTEAWRAWDAAAAFRPVDAVRDYMAIWLALGGGDVQRARELMIANRLFLGPWYEEVAPHLDSADATLSLIEPIGREPAAYLRGRHYTCALLAGHFGANEIAVQHLRHAFLGPGWADHFFIWHPPLREARRTPAFKQFMRDLGFAELWRTTNNWGDFARPLGDSDFECF